MKFPRSLFLVPLFLFCLIALAAMPALAQDWKPVDPADLALKAPVVEKDADAEAIFWEVRVDDSNPYELSLKNYIRIKVFNERGRESLFLTAASRRSPVILAPNAYTETVRVRLPAGFNVDEMPDPVKLNTPFGSYTTTCEVKDGQLVFTRTMSLRATTIAVEQYDQVRNFFARIRAAEQSLVVLAKK